MKLTDKAVAQLKLPPGKGELIAFDDALVGFGYRLRAEGGRSWIFQSGKNRMTIGKASALDASQAREIAKGLYARTCGGERPWEDKQQARVRAAETFKSCLDVYLARRRNDPRLRARSYTEIERHLLTNLKALHSTPIAELSRRSIAIEIGKLTNAGPVQANRTLTSLRKFLNWCCGQGYIENNPSQFIEQNPETSRDRVLTDAELRKLWHALPASDFADIVRLLLLTGCRRDEIGGLRWSEIDFDTGVVALPGSRTKNRRPHVVPMSASVRAILQGRPRHEHRDLVFGIGQCGFSGWGRRKAPLDAALQIPPWVIHDLRRTMATGLANLGVLPHVVEACLNHQSGSKAGVAGTYNRSTYEGEKAAALARWDEHLTAVVTGKASKVASLKQRA
jgi:integrase